MDQTVTAWGHDDRKCVWIATLEAGLWSPRCFIKHSSNNTSQGFHQEMWTCSFSILPPLCDKRQRTWFTLQLCQNNSRVKFRCQAQSITIHYQLSPGDWRFNFAAQQSSVQRKVAADEAVIIISASCLKIIEPRLEKKKKDLKQTWMIYVKFRREEKKFHSVIVL